MLDVLYVIGPDGGNTVKIGVSNKPDRRLRQIQLMSPVPLVIRWSRPGSYDLEDALHNRFAEHRSHGEWFTFPAYMQPVQAVRDAADALQYTVDESGSLQPWPDVPTCTPESRRYWLNLKLRQKLYNHPAFTLSQAAASIRVPCSFVEKYGAELVQAGSLIEQTVMRNGSRQSVLCDGQKTYVTAWDEGDRWDRLGSVSGARTGAMV